MVKYATVYTVLDYDIHSKYLHCVGCRLCIVNYFKQPNNYIQYTHRHTAFRIFRAG